MAGGAVSSVYVKRLMGELKRISSAPPSNVRLVSTDEINHWVVEIRGAQDTLFAGEVFTLRLRFPNNYPFEAPEAVFLGSPPLHPHVYSNGHICLSILYQQWSPALSTESLCLSLLSMLSSCSKKERPPGDLSYVARAGNKSPKETEWQFHGKIPEETD
ncbi:hypothetical protein GGI07_000596 [Coemansia sp. Benny D115]|nr:hypothetical protein GGI07_000596 [Coemansia sp. Benny D115]